MTNDPVNAASAPPAPPTAVKPGWLTSEHLLTVLAIVLVALEGSGIIPTGSGWLKAVEMGITVLAALGYTASRTFVKTAAILLVLAFLPQTSGCTWGKREATVVKNAAVDCTRKELAPAVANYAPVLETAMRLAMGANGEVDWSQVGQATAKMTGDDAGCVFATAVSDLIAQALPQPGAPKSSALPIDADDLRAHLRMAFPDKSFHTARGDL